jgi:hypothetical protein
MEMQGPKPSVLIGKLKQHLPHSISPDNDLFFGNVFDSPATFHERSGQCQKPQISRGYG